MSSYVPNTFEDRAAMLEKIGVKSIADLFDVPKGCEADLNLPAGEIAARSRKDNQRAWREK